MVDPNLFSNGLCKCYPVMNRFAWKMDPLRTDQRHIPQQARDAADCAVYACAFALLLAIKVPHPWDFTPQDAKDLRKQMVLELQNGELSGIDQGVITPANTWFLGKHRLSLSIIA